MSSTVKEIILEIENVTVTCNKQDLISNSDYFKAMFEGNFIESSRNKIKLEDVNLKAMNIILAVLWDESYLIPNEDILSVLKTACMLQFMKIRSMCLERIREMLSPKNCINIWHITERLDIKPLFLKAKTMALEEFLEIKDGNSLLEFTVEEICNYLGHINLRTDNELSVFQTVMKWWYENSELYLENPTNILIKLLSCIDFQNLINNHLKEIMVYPDIAENVEITEILTCISSLKSGEPVEHLPEMCQKNARLLLKSRSRVISRFPCFLVCYVQSSSKKEQLHQIIRDKFKRKRSYEMLDKDPKNDILTVIYYDYNTLHFKKFFEIDGRKCFGLEGFKLVGYKEFVFIYGGEFLIGKGDWNYNFWVYDTIRERLERKSVLPFPRRHFETCMVGDTLYIVGGTGDFRVIQENMFWYHYKDDKWSARMALPCSSRQLKCCSFLDQLFILNVNSKCGYFFNEESLQWLKMDITVDDMFITNEVEFAIFSYKDRLYVKGKNLVEFKVVGKDIIVTSVKEITDMICDKMELVLCGNIVYTYYKYKSEDNDAYSLEIYNLDTDHIDFIFKDVSSNDTVIDSVEDEFIISSNLRIFPFLHYSLVEKNNLVNDNFA